MFMTNTQRHSSFFLSVHGNYRYFYPLNVKIHPPVHIYAVHARVSAAAVPLYITAKKDNEKFWSPWQKNPLPAKDSECSTAPCDWADDPPQNDEQLSPPDPERCSCFAGCSLIWSTLFPQEYRKRDNKVVFMWKVLHVAEYSCACLWLENAL